MIELNLLMKGLYKFRYFHFVFKPVKAKALFRRQIRVSRHDTTLMCQTSSLRCSFQLKILLVFLHFQSAR